MDNGYDVCDVNMLHATEYIEGNMLLGTFKNLEQSDTETEAQHLSPHILVPVLRRTVWNALWNTENGETLRQQ
jgi:hypothetical protein